MKSSTVERGWGWEADSERGLSDALARAGPLYYMCQALLRPMHQVALHPESRHSAPQPQITTSLDSGNGGSQTNSLSGSWHEPCPQSAL